MSGVRDLAAVRIASWPRGRGAGLQPLTRRFESGTGVQVAVAQRLERRVANAKVASSILVCRTKINGGIVIHAQTLAYNTAIPTISIKDGQAGDAVFCHSTGLVGRAIRIGQWIRHFG